MLNAIVKWAIVQRWLVVVGAIVTIFWIGRTVTQMPLDVLPSFAPPQIEIQTEAPGLAPEEVESLISLPLDSAINGTPGVTTVRSSSAAGISVVRVVLVKLIDAQVPAVPKANQCTGDARVSKPPIVNYPHHIRNVVWRNMQAMCVK